MPSADKLKVTIPLAVIFGPVLSYRAYWMLALIVAIASLVVEPHKNV